MGVSFIAGVADAIGPAWDLSKAAWSSASAGPPVLGLSGVNLLLLIIMM